MSLLQSQSRRQSRGPTVGGTTVTDYNGRKGGINRLNQPIGQHSSLKEIMNQPSSVRRIHCGLKNKRLIDSSLRMETNLMIRFLRSLSSHAICQRNCVEKKSATHKRNTKAYNSIKKRNNFTKLELLLILHANKQ